MPEDVVLRRSDGLATIVLNASHRRNALTTAMAQELIDACDEIDADRAIGAVVLQASGPYFCAGADRATLRRAGEDPAGAAAFAEMELIYRSFSRVRELEPPTVAAVRGGAIGAGMNLVLATDLRVVASNARLESGFLRIGLHPGGGHSTLLGRTLGWDAAAALAMFGQALDGGHAVELGLAWRAVPAEEVDQCAVTIAGLPASDPELSRRTARSFRVQLGPPATTADVGLQLERAAQMWSLHRQAARNRSSQRDV
jgi:enoyl-CoA hydratase